ncbi:hypothetical protein TRVA0_036S00716 [Trichomonascus vanleenenianus]|uniref:uncharacterized protein n=1 Tax=Trichomonascus vanleenenianus TaxID=2268995 RepID=UPI003ECA9292
MNTNSQDQCWWPPAYPTQGCPEITVEFPLIEPEPEKERPKLPTSIFAVEDSNAPALGGRTIVVCLDGTGDKFDGDNSNVVDLVSCLKKDDPSQVTYYQAGIGTYSSHGITSGISAAFDMAIGSSLGVHIKDAYRFLMETYREGDRICLFGFSRGAYTARCLAGMLHKVGLLPPYNTAQVQFAYQIYKDDSDYGWEMSTQFRKTFSMEVSVYFLGVWDCVASVGFIPRTLPLSSTNTSWVHNFRHAMSLDERRAKFKNLQWQQQDNEYYTLYMTPQGRALAKARHLAQRIRKIFSHHKEDDEKAKKKRRRAEQLHPDTDVEEVWFAGCHCDVGGGSELNNVRHKLSRIPLRWMIRQCFERNTGIIFDTTALAETGLDVHSVWPVYKKAEKPHVGPPPDMMERYFEKSLPPIHRRSTALGFGTQEQAEKLDVADLLPEQAEDYFDSRARINDQLKIKKSWWLLEFWPIDLLWEISPGQWEKVVGPNRGRHRVIRDNEPKMHWTVEQRMNEIGYEIKNRLGAYSHWKVSA